MESLTSSIAPIITVVLLLIAVGVGVPAAVLRTNAQVYRERAESTEKSLAEIKDEMKDLKRDHACLKEDQEKLKDKYIAVLEESRNDLRNLCSDVRHELKQLNDIVERRLVAPERAHGATVQVAS